MLGALVKNGADDSEIVGVPSAERCDSFISIKRAESLEGHCLELRALALKLVRDAAKAVTNHGLHTIANPLSVVCF